MPAKAKRDLVGIGDIARMKGVKPSTVTMWRVRDAQRLAEDPNARRILPPEDYVVERTPIWERSTIEEHPSPGRPNVTD